MSGIHVRLGVDGVKGCPVAAMSGDFEVESVVTDRQAASGGGAVVGEVTVKRPPEELSIPDAADVVFSDGSRSVLRFEAEGEHCPCGRVPDHGCPVRDIDVVGGRAADRETASGDAGGGTVVVSFLVSEMETVRRIISDLQARCDSVRIHRLMRSDPDDSGSLLLVDRSAFTDRQYEVLRTAHEMGYFERPKAANSADVASALGITASTFTEHLAATQSKLLDQILSV
ncbi:hypothetical protein SAMN04488063_0646 [Halopelagius inordinatus]|uniref:Uncharacterized protein n=1 Tax=Halopelagius inordinatus TaxID=553467 RepID=A0A1I2MA58_9EURY|nr:hypothetical protein SAMN04488063_0646 [Halopelagius inordinatus]